MTEPSGRAYKVPDAPQNGLRPFDFEILPFVVHISAAIPERHSDSEMVNAVACFCKACVSIAYFWANIHTAVLEASLHKY